MALYAFDGTWNEDEEEASQDTNVRKFADAYHGNGGRVSYIEGVGTRFGSVGRSRAMRVTTERSSRGFAAGRPSRPR